MVNGPTRVPAVNAAERRGQPWTIWASTSTRGKWVARCLEALGHEVIVADPNFAPMYATRTRKVKTDRRDARALADACVLGAYRRAHRLSDVQRHGRGRLLVRDAIVRTRTRDISVIRALLRQQGYRVPSGSAEAFPRASAPWPSRGLRLPVPTGAAELSEDEVEAEPGMWPDGGIGEEAHDLASSRLTSSSAVCSWVSHRLKLERRRGQLSEQSSPTRAMAPFSRGL
jgi:hypothetical protein